MLYLIAFIIVLTRYFPRKLLIVNDSFSLFCHHLFILVRLVNFNSINRWFSFINLSNYGYYYKFIIDRNSTNRYYHRSGICDDWNCNYCFIGRVMNIEEIVFFVHCFVGVEYSVFVEFIENGEILKAGTYCNPSRDFS